MKLNFRFVLVVIRHSLGLLQLSSGLSPAFSSHFQRVGLAHQGCWRFLCSLSLTASNTAKALGPTIFHALRSFWFQFLSTLDHLLKGFATALERSCNETPQDHAWHLINPFLTAKILTQPIVSGSLAFHYSIFPQPGFSMQALSLTLSFSFTPVPAESPMLFFPTSPTTPVPSFIYPFVYRLQG